MPGRGGGSENPYPGSEATTTWNASSARPPFAAGSASNCARLRCSVNELGQPWVSTIGSGCGPWPRTWTKCTRNPSTQARKWAKRLSARSWARQSKLPAHVASTSRRYSVSAP